MRVARGFFCFFLHGIHHQKISSKLKLRLHYIIGSKMDGCPPTKPARVALETQKPSPRAARGLLLEIHLSCPSLLSCILLPGCASWAAAVAGTAEASLVWLAFLPLAVIFFLVAHDSGPCTFVIQGCTSWDGIWQDPKV